MCPDGIQCCVIYIIYKYVYDLNVMHQLRERNKSNNSAKHATTRTC